MRDDDWDGHIVQYVDGIAAAIAGIHYGGGTVLSRLEQAMNDFFDGSGGHISYGGAQQGNEVKVGQVTVKGTNGATVTNNPDGSTTLTKIDSSNNTKSVATFDANGNMVLMKFVKIEVTQEGRIVQHYVDSNGNSSATELFSENEAGEFPQIYIDPTTGHTHLSRVESYENKYKTVIIHDENGKVVDKLTYKYEVLSNGQVVEKSTSFETGISQERVIIPELSNHLNTKIEMGSSSISAVSVREDGSKVLAFVWYDGALEGYNITFETRANGQVIQKNVSYTGEVEERELISEAGGAGVASSTVDEDGSITFIQSRADGSKTIVHVNEWGLSNKGVLSYDVGPNGKCIAKYVDSLTGFEHTRTLVEETEGSGIPLVVKGAKGEVYILVYEEGGAVLKLTMGETGLTVQEKTRTTFEYVTDALGNGRYIERTEKLIGGSNEITTLETTGGWIDEEGTRPPETGTPSTSTEVGSDRWEAVHGDGGLWDTWRRMLDWSLKGAPNLENTPQTIGDSKWEGWKENGGTIDREALDFTGVVQQNSMQKTFRAKASGADHDLIQGTDGIDLFYGGAGNDTISGGGDSDVLSGEDGNDVLDGGNGHDALHGGHGDDTIYGGAGDDLLDDGLAGTKDGLNVTGNDYMDGGAGNDRIEGRLGNDTLLGGAGNDSLIGGDGNDSLDGGEGKDFLSGGNGDDRMFGGSGNDALHGNHGDDLIEGGEGNDAIDGGTGDDQVFGGTGDDVLLGNTGSDLLDGGAGDDLLHGGSFNDAEADTLIGGAGTDTVDYSNSWSRVHVNLSGGYGDAGAALGDRLKDIENVLGSAYDDTIIVGTAESMNFNIDDYLAKNADVAATIAANGFDRSWAYHHWVSSGRFEGRAGGWAGGSQLGADWGAAFDVAGYLAANPDVAAVKKANGYDDAWVQQHWLEVGAHGGRSGAFKVSGSVIDAGAGNDTVYGGVYSDYLIGGAGNDSLLGYQGHDVIVAGEGNDSLRGGAGNDQLYGGKGHDYFDAGEGDDTLYGGEGDDTLYGGSGSDWFQGGTGHDIIIGDDGVDALMGGDGDDSLNGGAGQDWLQGDDGNDVISGGADGDKLYGMEGHDLLIGDDGYDYLWGGAGSDTLHGGEGHDWLYGEGGDDFLYGGEGVDGLVGGTGRDYLYGGAEYDWLQGDEGNDTLWGGTGDDVLHGGSDHDLLYGQEGHDALNGDDGYDTLFGGEGNDELSGGDQGDWLYGGTGSDTMRGGQGDDTLYGEEGDDALQGNAGNDTLCGGAGNDKFVFHANSGFDVIKDFGYGDVIRLMGVSSSTSDFWGNTNNKPKNVSEWFVHKGVEITVNDGRKILIEGIKAEQLKGGMVDGAWQWWL